MAAVSVTLAFLPRAHAQGGPMPIGQVSAVTPLKTCPSGFYSPAPPATQTVCYSAAVDCPNTNSIWFTFSYVVPANPIGTIAIFSSAGGTSPSTDGGNDEDFAMDYYNANYAVIQSAWGYDWEDTNGLVPIANQQYNILNAACRPATLLSYIDSNVNFHVSGKPVCAQGSSAGSGGIGYGLTWYNTGSFLTNVELLSGPVFSNIKAGCQVGNSAATCENMCSSAACGGGSGVCGTQSCINGSAFKCSPGTLNEVAASPWTGDPHYIDGYARAVQNWTGSLTPACNNSQGQSTGGNDPTWLAMSIVNGQGGTFTYGSGFQGMGGWLCYSNQTSGGSCGPACPNNSGPQGEIFYDQFSASNSGGVNGYIITGIQQCSGAEGVAATGSYDPDFPNQGESGKTAIENHMEQFCAPQQ